MSVTHYGKNIGVGIAAGLFVALLAYEAQKLEKWQSPEGGSIYCVYANIVPKNPLHWNYGKTFAITADVPANYVNLGKVFSKSYFNLNTALAAGATIGIACGAANGYRTQP